MREWGFVDYDGVGSLIGAQPSSKEEVISVDSKAMNPSQRLIKGCPGHSNNYYYEDSNNKNGFGYTK